MARQFLQLEERPTGLCIVNDYVAMAFMVEVMRAGVRIPEDVSIVGHDNQPIVGLLSRAAHLGDPARRQDRRGGGRSAARPDRRARRRYPANGHDPGDLVPRQSVAVPSVGVFKGESQ